MTRFSIEMEHAEGAVAALAGSRPPRLGIRLLAAVRETRGREESELCALYRALRPAGFGPAWVGGFIGSGLLLQADPSARFCC